MSDDLWALSACEMANGIRTSAFSSREVTEACLQRAYATNPAINALSHIMAEQVLTAADAADAKVRRGEALGLLHGVPVTIKGNVDLAGSPTVNGSAALAENIATASSPPAQAWLNAGAIVLGRTNTPEFCVRWETTNNLYGATRNPWDLSRTPGGSSGGAAASVCVGMTPLAHGTDLGGSLRHPAQACGIASIRPSLGRIADYVPSEHEAAIGMQLCNTDGPMARRIADVRLGLQAMAQADWRDPWQVPAPLDPPVPSRLPIAVITDPLGQGVDPQVAAGVQIARAQLAAAGCTVEDAEPATLADAVEAWKNIVVWELFNGLQPAVRAFCGPLLTQTFARYHEVFGPLSAENHIAALRDRRRILRDWMGFFQRYSVIIAPVSTSRPQVTNFDIATSESARQTVQSMRMLVAINALGLPSVVVPVGIRDGLPQAVQVIGAPFTEMHCLHIAELIEQSTPPITPITQTWPAAA